MKITKSTDWQYYSVSLKKQMSGIGYNPDLLKMFQNIEKMISDLSKLEVEYRRTNKISVVENQLAQINKSITHFENLLLMAQLMR
jgi:hypothetical protein